MPKTKKYAIETEIRADDKFSRTVGRMSRGMQRFNRIAGRTKAGLRAVGRASLFLGRQAAMVAKVGLVAIAGAATAVFLSVTRLAGGMDELAKTTRAIDFDIEKFQEFRFAAEQTGVSGDKFNTIVKKFSATVGEFKGGYGTLFTALKRIDPQLGKQLKNTTDTSEAFELYLKAIGRAPNALKKTALASAAFGKRMGIDIINMANLSGEQLEKLRAQMRANGIVTAEQAAKAEAFNDSMNRLKLTAKGLAIDALSPLMPLLEKGADSLRDWIIQNRALISQKVHAVFEKLQKFGKRALNFLRNNIPPLIEQLQQIGRDGLAWVQENRKELREFGGLVLTVGKTFLKITGWVWKNKEAVFAAAIAYKALGISMNLLNWSGLMSGAGNASTAIGGLTGKAKGLAGVLGKGGMLFAAFSAGWGVGSAIFSEWNTAMDNLLLRASNTASRIGMTVHKMENKELESRLAQVQKQKTEQDSLWTGVRALLTGRFGEREEARKVSRQAEIDILTEQLKRLKLPTDRVPQPVAQPKAQSSDQTMDFTMEDTAQAQARPQAQSIRTESVKTERVELIIKDENNRAEIKKKPTSKGLSIPRFGTVGA